VISDDFADNGIYSGDRGRVFCYSGGKDESDQSAVWKIASDRRTLTLRPFSALGDETYRFYHKIEAPT
jgi:hypothetical protein